MSSFSFSSLFFFLSSCSFLETNTNSCYFRSACWILSSCFDICRGANFIPLLSVCTLLAAHPPDFNCALGSSCLFEGYFSGSTFKGANLILAPTSWLWTAVAAQALCLNAIGCSLVFLVPIQLVGFLAANSCYLFSASSILSSWAVFSMALKVVFELKFELVKFLAELSVVDIPPPMVDGLKLSSPSALYIFSWSAVFSKACNFMLFSSVTLEFFCFYSSYFCFCNSFSFRVWSVKLMNSWSIFSILKSFFITSSTLLATQVVMGLGFSLATKLILATSIYFYSNW